MLKYKERNAISKVNEYMRMYADAGVMKKVKYILCRVWKITKYLIDLHTS